MFRSLRAQLSISILLTLLVTIALVSLLGGWFVNREFGQYVAGQEARRSESIVHDLGIQYDGERRGWDPDLLHTIGMYSLYDGYILKVADADGAVVWDAENHDMSLCGQIMQDIAARMDGLRQAGGFLEHVHGIHQGGQTVGTVSITYYGPYFYSQEDFRFISALNRVLLAIGLLAALLAVVVGSLLARRIARPVAKTAYIAKQIAQGNYGIRFGREHTRELNDLAEAIDQLSGALAEQESLRRRLTTDVAHELRTPLAAVETHLEAMLTGMWEVTPERLGACHAEVQRLGGLVADLQRLAQVEGGNTSLKKTRVDLQEIARLVAGNMAADVAGKGLALSVEGTPAIVLADWGRLVQVATNLVSNAVKYTPEGGHIRLETISDDCTGQGGTGVLKVHDDGVGIPAQELPLIFERFYRTDKSRSRRTGGAGIGLTIAKSIVAAHGGTITVDSREGQGSCFTVSLPQGEADGQGSCLHLREKNTKTR
ncbi:MAG: HAMP domain-containing histidine kinase [Clostridiales Family XIII bacterium]|jgi:signal transduction histidine kinase|nr:HAMP domain-containing histidine kinase [Clostridiales Family XIII bacterium]